MEKCPRDKGVRVCVWCVCVTQSSKICMYVHICLKPIYDRICTEIILISKKFLTVVTAPGEQNGEGNCHIPRVTLIFCLRLSSYCFNFIHEHVLSY